MKAYDQLTTRGKLRRLRQLSLKALEHYDLQLKRLRFLTVETNTMFRVDTQDGNRYVLRIYSDEETRLQDNLAEIFWLNALRRDTDLKVTEPVPRRDGQYMAKLSVAGVPGERRCVLFKWVPGRCLERYLSPRNYYKLGQVLASLHDHAQTLRLPADIQPKRWDKVFYYPDEQVVYPLEAYRHLFPAERRALLDAVIERADRVFAELYADVGGRMLIHGDLHYWNVHVHRGQLYVIDFEDVMLGYPVQDVAITLSYGRDRGDYNQLSQAFKQGYASLRPWPVSSPGQVETLIAARNVMFINYVARIWTDPEAYIEERCGRLRRFLVQFS